MILHLFAIWFSSSEKKSLKYFGKFHVCNICYDLAENGTITLYLTETLWVKGGLIQ